MATKKKYKGLVIVESPAKARKISGFLGKNYKVLASIGHVRDLPVGKKEVPKQYHNEPWVNLAVNTEDDFSPIYVVPSEKKKIVKELKAALKDSEELIIATDEDREGESIGWHLVELLAPKVPVSRMVFSEITKTAIQHAIQHTRELDTNLVSAQETRRVLDRLYGFTLSPLLWKKIAGGRSAGRVQSVAVRLIVLRELERMAFKSGSYWDIKADLETGQQENFSALLVTVNGKKIATGKDFDESTGKLKEGADVLLLEEKDARDLQQKLLDADWSVSNIAERNEVRRPYPPFTTSTLQQEANRKLNMDSRQTMQVAQRLYEGGHITYMRTDSVNLSNEAINAARDRVKNNYGDDYLSPHPRQFSTKSQNAQEAHEAIRPSGTEMKTADDLGLSGPEFRLYDLIWKRTVATQMADAQLKFQSVTIQAEHTEFRATGRIVTFPGFFRAYVEGVDDPDAALQEQQDALPEMKEKDQLACKQLDPSGHETKPPARYTEASLVKALEANGVGRPSTYASIISTIQERKYAQKKNKQLIPTFTAVAVNRLLEQYFPRLVDTEFTAQMEQRLDDIASGQDNRVSYLADFYNGKDGLNEQVQEKEEQIERREACTLKLEGIDPNIRLGNYGPYFVVEEEDGDVTVSLPDDIAPADLDNEMAQELIELKKKGPQSIGIHPETGDPIYLMNGPFGPYVQLGEGNKEEDIKPKRSGIPNNFDWEHLTLDEAVGLLSLPKRLGHHPETNKVVNVGMGRYGPYVLHDRKYGNFDRKTHTFTTSSGEVQHVLTVTLESAIEMLNAAKSRTGPTPIKELGEHPNEGGVVAIFEGRYGPYVKHGKINATIPKDYDPKEVTLEQAMIFIEEKAARKGTKKKRAKKKKATKKTAKKKKATKKSATKKTTKATSTSPKKLTRKKSAKKTVKKKTDE